MRTTLNLLRKTLCYQQQTRWGMAEGFGPLITLLDVKTLHSELRHRPPSELQIAAARLGVDLVRLRLHEC